MFSKKLKKIIKIDGMSCSHCAKKVEDILLSIDGITKAKVNLKEKIATITLNNKIDNSIIKEKIDALDYKVLDINDL